MLIGLTCTRDFQSWLAYPIRGDRRNRTQKALENLKTAARECLVGVATLSQSADQLMGGLSREGLRVRLYDVRPQSFPARLEHPERAA